ALARAFDAERICRARYVTAGDRDGGQIVGARDRVVEERSRQELTAGRIVDASLRQGLADPLSQRAVHLAVHDHRVHRAAGVIHHGEGDDVDGTRVGVDLELAHGAAVGERECRVLVHRGGAERGAERWWQLAGGGRARELEDADRPVGPYD